VKKPDRNCVVGRPGIIHRRGEVKEISGMHRWIGSINANGGEDLFIPCAGDRLVGLQICAGDEDAYGGEQR
jgi:hypothetical protein